METKRLTPEQLMLEVAKVRGWHDFFQRTIEGKPVWCGHYRELNLDWGVPDCVNEIKNAWSLVDELRELGLLFSLYENENQHAAKWNARFCHDDLHCVSGWGFNEMQAIAAAYVEWHTQQKVEIIETD